jgi:hypothetical protein
VARGGKLAEAPEESHLSLNELARMGEFTEGCVWEDHYLAAPEYIGWEQGLHIDHLGSAIVLSLPRSEDPFYNRVIGLGLVEPVNEEMLDELTAYIFDTGTRFFIVHISPSVQPPEIHDWLRWRGFWLHNQFAKFYRDNQPPLENNTDLRIELTGPDYADAFAYVVTQTFGVPEYMYPWMKAVVGRPNWYHYVAWDGEEPAAAGAMYIRDKIGWLGHGSTLPAFRRRGAQGAILSRRIQDGINLGCEWFIADTDEDTPERPNASYRNMLRNGFKLAYMRWNYLFQAY